MLGIDIALLAAGGVLLVAAVALVGGRVGARREARRRQRQGERNAEQEKQRLEERCTVCGVNVDPAEDIWESGQWWHRGCYREAVR
jgi:fructose-1,6-bisphosphatase/sedoheptulose 1,7-bisphosphatase-like protein